MPTDDVPSIELIPLDKIPVAIRGPRNAPQVAALASRLADAIRLNQGLIIRLRPHDRPSAIRGALDKAAKRAGCGISVAVGEKRPYSGNPRKTKRKILEEPAVFYVRPRLLEQPAGTTPPPAPHIVRTITALPRRATVPADQSRIPIPPARREALAVGVEVDR